jgi:AcrR family transcriptional regulator
MNRNAHETKKSLLLSHAAEMIERDGYEGFKIAELAAAASVSISTVYTLFESKEGIYLAYIESKIAALFSAIEADATEDAFQRLERYAAVVCDMAEQGKIVLEQGVQSNPLFFTAMSNEFSESAQKLYAFLAECFSQINPSLDERQAYQLGYGFNGQLHGYLQYWAAMGGDLDALMDEVCDTFFCLATDCSETIRRQTMRKKGDR